MNMTLPSNYMYKVQLRSFSKKQKNPQFQVVALESKYVKLFLFCWFLLASEQGIKVHDIV